MKHSDNTLEWMIISDINYQGKLYIFRYHKDKMIYGRYPGVNLYKKITEMSIECNDYKRLIQYIDDWCSGFSKETGLNREHLLNAL